MDELDQRSGEGDDEALLRRRLGTSGSNDGPQVRPFRRRRSSGLLFQVRRRKPRPAPGL